MTVGYRSCTASMAGVISLKRRSTTCRDTPAARPVRIGNGGASTSGRTTCTAPCSTRSFSTPDGINTYLDGSGPSFTPRRSVRRMCGDSPTRGSGSARHPQHYVSSKLMCWVGLDRATKLGHIRGDAKLANGSRATAGRDTRRDPRTRSERSRRAPSALRHRHAGCLGTPCPQCSASWLTTTIGCAAPCWRSPRTSLRTGSSSATEPTRPTTASRQGGASDLLVLARLRLGRHRRAADGPRPHGATASRRVTAWSLRRGVRRGNRTASRQLPPGVLTSGADRSGRPDHRR